ncbi:MAG: DUF1353 domain-containing protein [Fusobacteriaceae bacterium]
MEIRNFSYYKDRGYYILSNDATINIKGLFTLQEDISNKSYSIVNGVLTINKWYKWNGANAMIDTQAVLRGSLVHDCLYECIKTYGLSIKNRREADIIFKSVNEYYGMNKIKSTMVYNAVRIFGRYYV